jgi:hypothetical protein
MITCKFENCHKLDKLTPVEEIVFDHHDNIKFYLEND